MKTNRARAHVVATTVAEFLANGGKVTRCPPADAETVMMAHLGEDAQRLEVKITAAERAKLVEDERAEEVAAIWTDREQASGERERMRELRAKGNGGVEHAHLARWVRG